MAETVEITLSARPEFVAAVRHVFGALARLTEFSAESVEDLKLAISESVTNALTRQSGHEGAVRIVAEREADGLSIQVIDSGPPIDSARLEGDWSQDESSSQEFSFETGLSLPVMRGLVDDLDFDAGADGGLTVRFRVRSEVAAD
jgi:serine/threonine-protein kinase RsbW